MSSASEWESAYHVPVEAGVGADIVGVDVPDDISKIVNFPVVLYSPMEWSASGCLVLRNDHAHTMGTARDTYTFIRILSWTKVGILTMYLVINESLARVKFTSGFAINKELLFVSFDPCQVELFTHHIRSFNGSSTVNIRHIAKWLFVRQEVRVQASDISQLADGGFLECQHSPEGVKSRALHHLPAVV